MSRIKILCAEHDPAARRMIASVLRSNGYTVLTARNRAEASALASKQRIDIVIVDQTVCRQDHQCLRDMLIEQQPSIKAFLHTGSPDTPHCLGAVPVLLKPILPQDIVAKIKKTLSQQSNARPSSPLRRSQKT